VIVEASWRGVEIGGDEARAATLVGEHRNGRAELSGSAISTLERVAVDESRLQGMETGVIGQALDGGHMVAVVGDGEGEAAVDTTATDEHGAGAALAVVAALLGAGQAELLAEQVEQGEAGVDDECVVDTVDADRDL
jgi:hypothetical protein